MNMTQSTAKSRTNIAIPLSWLWTHTSWERKLVSDFFEKREYTASEPPLRTRSSCIPRLSVTLRKARYTNARKKRVKRIHYERMLGERWHGQRRRNSLTAVVSQPFSLHRTIETSTSASILNEHRWGSNGESRSDMER